MSVFSSSPEVDAHMFITTTTPTRKGDVRYLMGLLAFSGGGCICLQFLADFLDLILVALEVVGT